MNIRAWKGVALSRAAHVYHFGRYDAYPRFVRFGKRVGWWKVSAVGGLIAGVLITLLIRGLPENTNPVLTQGPRSVYVRSVAELSGEAVPLSVVGTVTSQSEATVRTESSGEVTGVYASLGQFVQAGQIIAELDNARERAAVLQSEGVFDGAKAQLAKVRRGARDEQLSILETSARSAEDSLATARTNTVNTLLSVYSTIDDTVRHKADQMFTNPDTSAPKFTIQSADSSLVSELESARVRVQEIWLRQTSSAITLSESDDLSGELARTDGEIREVKSFFDKLVSALNKAVPSQTTSDATIATYKTEANTARASVSALLTSITTAKDNLASKTSALEIAKKNLEQGVTGAQPEDIAAAEATLKQAQGALAAARANLEKTIIRAPISGSINALPINRGDFVSSFAPAVTIANNKALEIVAYVTEVEAREIVVGADVDLEGGARGIVTRLAPAIDPATKKVEVRIGVPQIGTLVNGQAVTVNFQRNTVTATPTSLAKLIIPISALKVGSDRIIVFSVSSTNTLVAHEVKIGTLLGDKVMIASGIDANLEIVLDARGLKEGDTITIKQ